MNYLKIYNCLIEKRRQFPLTKESQPIGTVAYHHIIPKACGGQDTSNNIIGFTHREHYIAHQLLVKIYSKTQFELKMIQARNYIMFSSKLNIKFTAKQYQQAKETQGKLLQYRIKNGIIPAWNKGKKLKPLTLEQRKLRSIKNTGKICVNNGIETIRVDPNKIPIGYVKGRLPNKNPKPKGQIPWNKGKKLEYKPKYNLRGKVPWNKGLKGIKNKQQL